MPRPALPDGNRLCVPPVMLGEQFSRSLVRDPEVTQRHAGGRKVALQVLNMNQSVLDRIFGRFLDKHTVHPSTSFDSFSLLVEAIARPGLRQSPQQSPQPPVKQNKLAPFWLDFSVPVRPA